MSNDQNPFLAPDTGESKGSTKYSLSKFDFELFDEKQHEQNKKNNKVVRIKKSSMPNNHEKWRVMEDNDVVFTIESTKISKKERMFLQTLDGFNFLINLQKAGGIKSLNYLKAEIKKNISTTNTK